MAQTTLTSFQKAFQVLGLFSIALLIQKGNAFEYKVGGTSGWTLPPDPNSSNYNQWAERNRFQIGDSLLFVYPADKDSVLNVNKDDYTSCNTENPLQKFSDGLTVFKFDHSGPYYFISGVKDNCLKNEKLFVVVMADRSNRTAPPPPSAEGPPSPAPSGEQPPSPGSVEINPTPAPSEQSKPRKNGASSILKSFIGPVGAFVGSFVMIVF